MIKIETLNIAYTLTMRQDERLVSVLLNFSFLGNSLTRIGLCAKKVRFEPYVLNSFFISGQQ